MKRQSKAEEALTREIRKIENQEQGYAIELQALQVKIEAIRNIRFQLEKSRAVFTEARRETSIRNKPKA